MPRPNYHYSKLQSLLTELDWDSLDSSHDKDSLGLIHWYPATFISNVPANLIELFSDPGDLIWDPFCGSGNVGLEAIKRDRRFFGNDCNLIAIKISNAKLTLLTRLDEIELFFIEIKNTLYGSLWSEKNENLPLPSLDDENPLRQQTMLELRAWYSSTVLEKLRILYSIVFNLTVDDIDIRNFFEVMFLSIARLVNAQQKTWGHIADNVKPKNEEIDARRHLNPINLYVDRTSKVIKKAQAIKSGQYSSGYCLSEVSTTKIVLPEKASLVVTSPPYPWMCDYTTSQRLSFYWLNYPIKKIDEFKQKEIGARYRRKQTSKKDSYVKDMVLCFENIHANMDRNAKLCLVYPASDSNSERGKTLVEVNKYLRSVFKLEASVDRHLEKYKRSSPFSSMDAEIITIWSK